MAGDQIARYRDKAAVPALIRLLGERFESSRLAQVVDTAFFFMMPPVALAAGVAGHRLSGQKQLRRQHARRLRRYAAALTRITGAKLGLSQVAWQRWAKAQR